ncbi:MAG: AAA family ATPase [Rubrivivax sp.]|nr:AAA family ATPase [Rubrivivax sp.]
MTLGSLRRLVDEAVTFMVPEVPDAQAIHLRPIALADLAHAEPPPVTYAWAGRIPVGFVTLLGGHGGSAKTTLATQLAICAAAARQMLGIDTMHSAVAFYSAEDGADQMRRGVHRICRAMQIDPAELEGLLHILDMTQVDPVLFHEVSDRGGRRFGAATPTLEALRAYVERHGIRLLVIDNASDTLDASENDRARVRGFMRALARIAAACDCAVLLLAHVDKGTSRGDRGGSESYSGSTAWHNSARSRLFLSRDREGALVLEHQKHNLGPLAEPLRMVWPPGGILQADQPLQGVVAYIDGDNDTKALLRLIHEFHGRGEHVSTATTSRTNAALLLAREPAFPRGRNAPEVFELLRGAERRGLIERQAFKGPDRKPRERWALTATGLGHIGAATAATAATPKVTAPTAAAAAPAATAATCRRGYGG